LSPLPHASPPPTRAHKHTPTPSPPPTAPRLWHDPAAVRQRLVELLRTAPELFPPGMAQGFQLTGRLPSSQKLPGVRLRQLRLADGRAFTLRPSFVLSYMTGTVDAAAY